MHLSTRTQRGLFASTRSGIFGNMSALLRPIDSNRILRCCAASAAR
jgi:hypothetical protein